MYESTLELAENKLMVLYILKSIKIPISNSQLTEMILENGFINYFTLQQYITELISSSFISYDKKNEKKVLVLSAKGEKVLSMFQDRISPSKTEVIEAYIKERLDTIKRELTLTSDYTIDDNGNFIVDLKAIENDFMLMDLKINVTSNKQAMSLCDKWKSNSSEIYNKIMQLLINS
ncbi:DUF4364 family protein [Clostridium algidicarnis]|uniref:Uncharacterized protein DUF4364 n=2 Tax=Clostridium algidicarnis TaxID=37659 RepID=A0A2S6FX99_9CLOT|nr:DUF4364 family protein [Clostridium algidicarnis]MBB6630236.1 DUF4364 family protein [Clostridium algidicarnis]MBU3195322.1 DUF4364 family protein [Clostridium algidicarnis]MBU3208281.1 DUF4364 family protein [Clostridium algidicarnis]MBU3220053.1 DUF4364 family protein [Clostridium algidicarnis]MBU3227487.1 DUF4364 family protein [Clostridium algidicarnis]